MRFGGIRKAGVSIGLAGVLVGGSAGGASAHAELQDSRPGRGATVTQRPDAVELTFTDDLLPLGAAVQVEGPGGVVQRGRPVVAGRSVRQPLGPGLTDGSYLVTWRLTSGDGHVLSGTYPFVLRAGGSAAPVASPTGAAEAGPAPSHRHEGLGTGWKLLGLLVLAATVAGAGLTEVRRRRRRAGGPRASSSG